MRTLISIALGFFLLGIVATSVSARGFSSGGRSSFSSGRSFSSGSYSSARSYSSGSRSYSAPARSYSGSSYKAPASSYKAPASTSRSYSSSTGYKAAGSSATRSYSTSKGYQSVSTSRTQVNNYHLGGYGSYGYGCMGGCGFGFYHPYNWMFWGYQPFGWWSPWYGYAWYNPYSYFGPPQFNTSYVIMTIVILLIVLAVGYLIVRALNRDAWNRY